MFGKVGTHPWWENGKRRFPTKVADHRKILLLPTGICSQHKLTILWDSKGCKNVALDTNKS